MRKPGYNPYGQPPYGPPPGSPGSSGPGHGPSHGPQGPPFNPPLASRYDLHLGTPPGSHHGPPHASLPYDLHLSTPPGSHHGPPLGSPYGPPTGPPSPHMPTSPSYSPAPGPPIVYSEPSRKTRKSQLDNQRPQQFIDQTPPLPRPYDGPGYPPQPNFNFDPPGLSGKSDPSGPDQDYNPHASSSYTGGYQHRDDQLSQYEDDFSETSYQNPGMKKKNRSWFSDSTAGKANPHMVLALVTCVLCFFIPLGCIAVRKSRKARLYLMRGEIHQASKYGRQSKCFSIVTIVIGSIAAITGVLIYVFLFSGWVNK